MVLNPTLDNAGLMQVIGAELLLFLSHSPVTMENDIIQHD